MIVQRLLHGQYDANIIESFFTIRLWINVLQNTFREIFRFATEMIGFGKGLRIFFSVDFRLVGYLDTTAKSIRWTDFNLAYNSQTDERKSTSSKDLPLVPTSL